MAGLAHPLTGHHSATRTRRLAEGKKKGGDENRQPPSAFATLNTRAKA